MKFSKIIAIFMIISFSFSIIGCKKDKGDDYVSIDGDGGEDNSGNSEEKITYVYSHKTLHRDSCYYARAMKDFEKKSYDGDISILVDEGYTFCGLCCSDEKIQYSEDDNTVGGVAREDASYFLNISSKRFHALECRYADSSETKNGEYTDLERDILIESGYSPCQVCNP